MEKKGTKEDTCQVIHCDNPPVADGYCEIHLERLERLREANENLKQYFQRARQDANAADGTSKEKDPAYEELEKLLGE